jgi:mono/diheme cytochrome c family protein
LFVPNLTPDSATGIGRRSDGELARMLRHDVRADGRAALPFMTAQDFSDEDLTAVISFLRSQPAVRNAVPIHDLNLMGKLVMAFMIKPKGPTQPPAATSPKGPTVENGRYLAHSVAACVSCHTARSMMTGAYTGPAFAGSEGMPVEGRPDLVVVPPNLTPDSATGRIAGWSEDAFIGRFRAGRAVEQSPMPWEFYGRMSDDDLRAIYRYLRTVPAVHNETGPVIRKKS